MFFKHFSSKFSQRGILRFENQANSKRFSLHQHLSENYKIISDHDLTKMLRSSTVTATVIISVVTLFLTATYHVLLIPVVTVEK